MNSFRHPDGQEDMPMQDPNARHPSLIVWSLHWVSALLVLYLLATSLMSGLGLSQRISPGNWMDWHLSSGIALLVITIIRLWTSDLWRGLFHVFAFRRSETGTTKSILLLTVFATVASGLTIFQKSPFGGVGLVFGAFPMPTLIRLNHSVHNLVIDLHIALAFAIAAVVIVHIRDGLRKGSVSGRSRFITMLWPWRKTL
jgi:cytochrome b561